MKTLLIGVFAVVMLGAAWNLQNVPVSEAVGVEAVEVLDEYGDAACPADANFGDPPIPDPNPWAVCCELPGIVPCAMYSQCFPLYVEVPCPCIWDE